MNQTARQAQQSIDIKDPQSLLTAFEQFGALSDQLQQSYQALDERTSALTLELATARSERMQQLAEKEKLADRLENLLKALPAGVLVIDEHGRVQTSNAAADTFFEQGLEGANWYQLLETNVEQVEAEDVLLKNGRVLSLSYQALAGAGNIVLINDVTKTRMLQDVANRQTRLAAMGQMAAGLAHQLRTPLASAVLYSSQLGRQEIDTQQQGRAGEKIRASLRYLEKLINDMLLYAKGGEFGNATFSLAQLLVSFKARMETRLQQTRSNLKIVNHAGLINLKGSQDALVSVLCNLAENAIEACKTECIIELKVYQQDENIILAIHDNGPGLSADQQLKIFQPFYSEREGGTGLGLAVAQSIAQAHQGDLLVRSNNDATDPMCGTTFYLCLPLNQGEQFLPSGKMTTPYNITGQNTGGHE
ncbi:MAG: PAS domain-containing sensor histidine kinase [Gammaproteobacteria bacterium]|nr:PAS domain-containing sensor histidine kinase [Gammaproteobacteria bacterium]